MREEICNVNLKILHFLLPCVVCSTVLSIVYVLIVFYFFIIIIIIIIITLLLLRFFGSPYAL